MKAGNKRRKYIICFEIKTFFLWRELKDREVAAMTPSPPIALQYLYGGSAVVQGEKDITPEVSQIR